MRIAIHGGDITGLIVAFILRRSGHDPCVIDNVQPGRSALTNQFRFLENNSRVKRFLTSLDVMYGEHVIASGLLVEGDVKRCKSSVVTPNIAYSYWYKTRLAHTDRKIRGPIGVVHGKQVLTLDWSMLVQRLLKHVSVTSKEEGEFDLHIETRPLWQSRFVKAPFAMAVTSNLVQIKSAKNNFIKWDLVYLPYTPASCIHLIYHHEGGYVCEFNGSIRGNELNLSSDLNWLFPDGWYLVDDIQETYGHLMPLPEKPVWPDGVIPIGRLAQWDEKVDLAKVIEEATHIGNGKYRKGVA